MKTRLPEYIANCFMVSGFDTLSIIAEMDVSSNPGNSVQQIEEYVNENNSEDPQCRLACVGKSSGKFKFPPGHRCTIEKFVKEMKKREQQKGLSRRNEPTDSQNCPKRRKTSKSTKSTSLSSNCSTNSIQ